MAFWQPNRQEIGYLELIVAMSTDCLLGRGVKRRYTYTDNLRMIADQMDKLNKASAAKSEKT